MSVGPFIRELPETLPQGGDKQRVADPGRSPEIESQCQDAVVNLVGCFAESQLEQAAVIKSHTALPHSRN